LKFHTEYYYCLLAVLIVVALYAISSIFLYTPMALFTAILSLFTGGFMIAFGFWGADYAFSVALGEIDQSWKKDERVKGKKGKVNVPFMGNYTPTEWWNINWVIVVCGCALAVLGAFMLGMIYSVM